jgi:hypothetical protein
MVLVSIVKKQETRREMLLLSHWVEKVWSDQQSRYLYDRTYTFHITLEYLILSVKLIFVNVLQMFKKSKRLRTSKL